MDEIYPLLMVVVLDPCMLTWENLADQTQIGSESTLMLLLCSQLTLITPVISIKERMAPTIGTIVGRIRTIFTQKQKNYS
jgi:glutamine amidotransferase PdxT